MKCFYCKNLMKEKKNKKGIAYSCAKCEYIKFVPTEEREVNKNETD